MISIISFITSPDFQEKLFPIKIIFGAVFGILFVAILVLLLKTRWLRKLLLEDLAEFFTFKPYGAKKGVKQWAKILKRLDTGLESEYKLALIEADSFLDEILIRMGFTGDSLEERFKKVTQTVLPNIEEVEEAHKTRNNIVHDPDYRLAQGEAREILSVYEKAFQDLDIL